MEYVDGRTLRDLLRDDRRLLPERALEITDGVLRALDYSHRNGIVHRDIKPGNVMLTRSGDVKVMDFGIARAVSDAQATMTQTAQVIGTAQYLSPEQARGERVDARSDLYSTGCLLYELLTGRPPFTGDSPVAIAYQHVRENPIPPSRVDPEIPPWADSIVLKAMAKDPADRYQSAAEMRNDIQRALSGVPVAAPPRDRDVLPGHAADGPGHHDGRRRRADQHHLRATGAEGDGYDDGTAAEPPGPVVGHRRDRGRAGHPDRLPAAARQRRQHRRGALRGRPDPGAGGHGPPEGRAQGQRGEDPFRHGESGHRDQHQPPVRHQGGRRQHGDPRCVRRAEETQHAQRGR